MDSSRRGFLKFMGIGAAIAAVPGPVRATLFATPAAPAIVEAPVAGAAVGSQFLSAQEYANRMLLLVKNHLHMGKLVTGKLVAPT